MVKLIKDLTLKEIERYYCEKHSCNGCELYIGYGLCLNDRLIRRFLPILMKEIEVDENN